MFTFNNEGFIIQQNNETSNYTWDNIETIFGYKTDLLTYDEICMDIFTQNNRVITLSEELPDWIPFNSKLQSLLPGFDISWYMSVMQPPFATNLTLLYDRQQRDHEAATTACYG